MTEQRPTEERDPSEMTREELNQWAEEQRKASYERTLANLKRVLSNEDGIARISAISNEEWDRAQALDDEDAAREAGNAPA